MMMAFAVAMSSSASRGYAFKSEGFTSPPRQKFSGPLHKNFELAKSMLIARNQIVGPEDVALDDQGRIYAGSSKNGKIYRVTLSQSQEAKLEIFAETGGTFSLGLHFDANQNLILCNSRGLLSVDKSGKVSLLTDSCDGVPITFPDDLVIASDGKIFFSNASSKFDGQAGRRDMNYDLLENTPNGSLYCFDPATGKTSLILSKLYFANGVVLSPHQEFLLIAETDRWRIKRYWLEGPQKGKVDIFANNLPGAPDGISADPDGGYWVALPGRRTLFLDFMCRHPKLKDFASHFPEIFWRRVPRYGLVVHLDADGKLDDSLQDPTGKVYYVTNAIPWHGMLYLGSLKNNAIAIYDGRSELRQQSNN